MTGTPISTQRVFELIEAYGAETGGWPADERSAAAALIAADPETFASALSEARALDALLEAEDLPEPSARLADLILTAAPSPKLTRNGALSSLGKLIFPQGMRWPAGAALASLLMGLVGGYSYASTGVGYDQADSAYYSAFGYEAVNEWLVSE